MIPNFEKKTVCLQPDATIDCTLRLVRKQKRDCIVFIHGFGSSKLFFEKAFSVRSMKPFNVITFDLPGFGLSRADKKFSFSMIDFARISLRLLDTLQIFAFHLVCHSMGGLIGIEMADLAPDRILSFSSLEGNLTIEDCFISGTIIRESYEHFRRIGRKRFEEALMERARKDPFLFLYWQSFRKASSPALYRSAQQTVKDSENAAPLKRFLKLKNKCYIYGEKNRNQFPGEKQLLGFGVPVFYISDAGHSMAEENPDHTYSVIAGFIKNRSRK